MQVAIEQRAGVLQSDVEAGNAVRVGALRQLLAHTCDVPGANRTLTLAPVPLPAGWSAIDWSALGLDELQAHARANDIVQDLEGGDEHPFMEAGFVAAVPPPPGGAVASTLAERRAGLASLLPPPEEQRARAAAYDLVRR